MVNRIKDLFESRDGKKVYATVRAYVDRCGMRDMLDGGVLLGLSGGADSVFLAAFMYEYRRVENPCLKVLCVHVNHGIRGAEADRDEAFSERLAYELGFDFEARHFDVPQLAREGSMGLEEAARNARYSAFADIIGGRNDISSIATAHNLTDNAETVTFNIARGSGAKGAMGIAPVKGNVIRPLLEIPKREIKSLLDKYSVEYVNDSTNDSIEYTRNYIRHEILPRMERINPKMEYAYGAFAATVREDDDFISTAIADVLRCARSQYVERERLASMHPAVFSRFISEFARYNGAKSPERCHILAIRELLTKNDFKYSFGGLDFVCERGVCRFSQKKSVDNSDFKQILHSGENELCGYAGAFFLGEAGNHCSSNVYKISIQADLSSAIINGGLYVRFKRDGDAYHYGGMTHKLKKVFNDRDIPPSHRSRIPIVCDDDGIVWVPGLGVREDRKKCEGEKTVISFLTLSSDKGEELYTALKETK